MNAVTVDEAKRNLGPLIARTIAGAGPTIIRSDAGPQVVFLSLDEFNSWNETIHLLGNPANAEHLRRSIAEAEGGRVRPREQSAE